MQALDVAVNKDAHSIGTSVNTYDLVILDVMIPKPNGFDVCHELRKENGTEDSGPNAYGERRGQ